MIWHPQVLLVFPSELAEISESLPADVSIFAAEDWLAGRTFLKHRPQTQRVFVPCGRPDRFGLRYLRRLRSDFPELSLSAFVPSAAFPDLERVVRAVELGVGVIHPPGLQRKLRALVGRPRESIAERALPAVGVCSPTAAALFDLFEEDGRAITMTATEIARCLGMGRTALFAALRDSGLSGLHSVQVLFRSLVTWSSLRGGRTEAEAAAASGYAEASSLRRALEKSLGLTIDGLATEDDWGRIVDRWASAEKARRP